MGAGFSWPIVCRNVVDICVKYAEWNSGPALCELVPEEPVLLFI